MEGIASSTNTPSPNFGGGLTGTAGGITAATGLGVGGMGDAAYYNGSGYKVEAKVGQQGIVGHGGDYAGARHSSESQGPGLPGTEDFGHSQRELSAVGGGKEPVQERRHDAVPHEMMPGSQTLSLEPCNTGPCEGPDCGGGVGCHGYGMGDD